VTLAVLAYAAALAAIAALAVAIWSRRRARAKPAPAVDSVPTFKVVALGSRGSGKTLLLASMYHQMQTPSGRGYFLTAPYEQVALLNQWFTEVADTSRAWPAGTSVGETRDFVFTVRTRAPSGSLHTVMHIGYLDRPGRVAGADRLRPRADRHHRRLPHPPVPRRPV
jgi:hypothetical protein